MEQQHKMTRSEAGRIGGIVTGAQRRKKSLKQYYLNPTKCSRCGKVILVRENQQVADVRHNKYCSHSCAARTFNIQRKQEIFCLFCNKKINGAGLKYCNIVCQNNYKQKCFIEKWKNGEIKGHRGNVYKKISSYIRTYLLEKYNYACQKCGWNTLNPYTHHCYLEVHHKDGNIENTSEDNLELLCPNCHSLTPNYKNNRIKGSRTWRRIKRNT